MDSNFREIGIKDDWIQSLEHMGITEPTSVQAQAIPAIQEGRDVIAQSQTGTGKTLAYLLPILQAIDTSSKQLQAVILVPTRELGMQIGQVIQKLTEEHETKIRAQVLIGGAAISRQIDKLKAHPQIIVGTPGRIVELMNLRKLTVHHVRHVVIDEVDQVYALGSANEIDQILKSMQKNRQLLFFSATISEEIERAAREKMQDPAFISVDPSQRVSASISHQYIVCEERNKLDTLRRLIHAIKPSASIAFVNATADIGEVLSKLQYIGLSVMALSGEAGKADRAQVMQAFRGGKFQLLLATDVASRGLDIEGVTHIFHLDLPANSEYYLHRVGRTGRMGREGTAISIVAPKEVWILEKIARQLGIRIAEKELYEGKIIEPGANKKGQQQAELRNGRINKVPTTAQDRGASSTTQDRNTFLTAQDQEASLAARDREASRATRDDTEITQDRYAYPAAQERRISQSPQERKTSKTSQGRKAAATAQDRKKKSRTQDRKNKGAPKWLKAKQNEEKK